MRKIISIGSSKESALYFDHIFPDDFLASHVAKAKKIQCAVESAIPFTDTKTTELVTRSLLPHSPDAQRLVVGYNLLLAADVLSQFNKLAISDKEADIRELVEAAQRHGVGHELNLETIEKDESLPSKLAHERSKILKGLGFARAPCWYNEDVFESSSVDDTLSEGQHFVLSMRGLNLVDPAKLSWDHVIEFRKDKKSRAALRDLRLFLHENFADKDPGFVSDKLSALEEENARVAKLWGFETTQRALTVAFTERSALMISAGGIASLFAGAPLGLAAAAAAVVPVGRFALEFSKAVIDSAKARSQNPVKYLSDLRKLQAEDRESKS